MQKYKKNNKIKKEHIIYVHHRFSCFCFSSIESSWNSTMSGKRQQNAQKTGPPNKKTYVDSVTGRKVNDYIPKFISSTPWYYNNESLTVDSKTRKRKTDDELYREISDKSNDRLKHQRLNPDNNEIMPNNEPKIGSGIVDEFEVIKDNEDFQETEKKNQISLKRKIREWKKKGRCENCGGKHSKIECFEKPHAVSFIYRNDNDKDGEKKIKENGTILVKKDTDAWDTKRDRWRGIDMDEEYSEIVNNLKKKEQKVLDKYLENSDNPDDTKNSETIIKAILKDNPLALSSDDSTVITRSLDEKPRYLEVIKTGEELRYNPKSRVYKDLSQGYLNERGQFIPYLTGEAAEFEKMKKFTRSIQVKQKKKWDNDKESTETVTNKDFSASISPTTAMLKLKEKESNDEMIKETKRKELLKKYGAL